MINSGVRVTIGNFIGLVGEPYKLEQDVSFKGQSKVHEGFVDQPLGLTDKVRLDILTTMTECWTHNQSYRRIRDWGRAMVGFAVMLAFDEEIEAKRNWSFVADVVVRLARWEHSTHHWYTDMNKYAKAIVGPTWGSLPDLFKMYGASPREVYSGGKCFKLARYSAGNCRICLSEDKTELRPTRELFVDPQESLQLMPNSFDATFGLPELYRIIGFDPRTRKAS